MFRPNLLLQAVVHPDRPRRGISLAPSTPRRCKLIVVVSRLLAVPFHGRRFGFVEVGRSQFARNSNFEVRSRPNQIGTSNIGVLAEMGARRTQYRLIPSLFWSEFTIDRLSALSPATKRRLLSMGSLQGKVGDLDTTTNVDIMSTAFPLQMKQRRSNGH